MMGAYAYCSKCDQGLPAPWDMPLKDVVAGAVKPDWGYQCSVCQLFNAYYQQDMIDELVSRLEAVIEPAKKDEEEGE